MAKWIKTPDGRCCINVDKLCAFCTKEIPHTIGNEKDYCVMLDFNGHPQDNYKIIFNNSSDRDKWYAQLLEAVFESEVSEND